MTQTLGNASTAAMDLLKEKLDKIIVRELPFTYKEYIVISDTINKQVLDPDIKPPFLIETEWIAVERKFNPEFPTIEETMYQLWYLHFVCAISNRLSGAVTFLLQLEQEGHVADCSVLESAWHAFSELRPKTEELFSVDGSLDDRFSVTLEIAFREAISSDSFALVYGDQPAKLFAEYCNINLNKHRAARLIDCRELVADQDLEAQALNEIQQLQVIISAFNNKFELFMYYEMLLARRLVSNQYISLELERRALQDLKLSHILVGHADSSFRMISDKIGSDAITQKFIDCLARNSSGPQPAKVDISVCVFGSSVWPHAMQQTPEDSMRLPEIISSLYDSFENFYRREYHMKREISWNWRYSTATVKIYFPHTRSKRAAESGYTFVLNMYQLAILTLFIKPRGFGTDNSASVDAHYMTFDQIRQATQMKIARLGSEVSILVRTRILVDAGNQTLFLNHRFSPKRSFFNISTVRRIQKISEENLALRFLDRERSLLIQAQAIRLLKHSGKLCFKELFDKVLNNLTGFFDVKSDDFKNAIESLLIKNFLKRDDDNRDLLQIVDFDKGLVGSAVTQALLMQNQPEDHTRPLWQARSQDSDIGGEFGSVNSVREWVRLNGWAALVIHSNATQQLETALAQNGDNAKSYNPNDAMTLFVSSGHHPVVSIQIVEPATTADLGKATYAFAVSMVQEIQKGRISIPPLLTAASSDADSSSNNSNLAGIIAQPISYRQIDVAPFTFGIGPVSYLFSFLVGMLCTIGPMIGWKMSTFTFYLKVRHRDLWLAAVALLFAWAAYMGMLGALAFSAFRGPGYSEVALKYTVGRFFSLWATITITLMAVSVWLFCWFVLVPPEILGLASLVTILPNTMSTLVIAELAPHFFRWIHALPFYNGAMLYRYILSGAYPQIGANVGIILGEICVMSLTLWVVIWIRQHMVLDGTSDAAGWSYGSIFFYSPVPHHKKKQQAAEEFTT
ncbi:ubiquitin ligase (cullin) of SCF [Coemansia sp. Benny D160-2]|nr:ubiquitin ligase (cullin) of SCF [Coemansia sp. Benny D160-2]